MYISGVKLFIQFTLPLKRIETAVENHCIVIPRYNSICPYNVVSRYTIIPGTFRWSFAQASSAPAQKLVLKQQQTEAQKDATRLLKAKFKYPTRDPQPNTVQDKRTELEKIQSILRITSQILDKDTLQIWNSVCERNLHFSKQHNSGIQLLKQNITDEIKSYRLNQQHEQQLLQQVTAFDKL